jgi:hypothetical protein
MVSSDNPFTEAMRRWWCCNKCKKFNEITLESYMNSRKFSCKCGVAKEVNLTDLFDKDQVTEKGGQL